MLPLLAWVQINALSPAQVFWLRLCSGVLPAISRDVGPGQAGQVLTLVMIKQIIHTENGAPQG